MPASGRPLPSYHLLFISLDCGFLAVVPGFDICFYFCGVWQLITFPLQLFGLQVFFFR